MGQFDPDYRYQPKWPSQQEIHNQFLEEEIRRRERAEEERRRKEQQRGREERRQQAWDGVCFEEARRRCVPFAHVAGPVPDWFRGW